MSELPVDRAAQDLAGAVDFLLGHEAVTSSTVGAVGFCMGGGFVIVLAAQQGDRIGAAVPFYGVLKEGFTTPDVARGLADRIQKESGVTPQFLFYPAGHAFFNDENLLGTHDPEQATLAWRRTVEFLHANLG